MYFSVEKIFIYKQQNLQASCSDGLVLVISLGFGLAARPRPFRSSPTTTEKLAFLVPFWNGSGVRTKRGRLFFSFASSSRLAPPTLPPPTRVDTVR